MKLDPSQEYKTTDLALAAYLQYRGLRVIRTEAAVGERRSVFVFDDRLGIAGDQLAIEFSNSEFQKYDSHLRALKKLIHK